MSVQSAGARRRIISVEQHDGTVTNGEPTYETDGDWDVVNTLSSVPASYMGVSGGETIRGIQIEAGATGLFRILSTTRTRAIKPRMRIQMDSRKMNILSVIDKEGDQRELFITVKELADE